MSSKSVSRQTLERLPLYLSYLKALPKDSPDNISATIIAGALKLNHVQVRKDLAAVSSSGKPKIGYITEALIKEIEQFLGYDDTDDAVIVGAGKLGRALLDYDGFKGYGLNILAAFDIDESLVRTEANGKPVLPMDKLKDLCQRLKVHIGIITVPAKHAQEVCDILADCGILAIWNFAPVNLVVPGHILVQNENMASSLAILSNHLKEKFYQ